MRVYHIQGIRHCAVIFAASREEAIAQATERELVGDWGAPGAVEVLLLPGYCLAHDPLLVAEQPELPLSLAAPEAEKPRIIANSGVEVCDDWRDNTVVDRDAPSLVWKAGQGVFGTHTSVRGCLHLVSENADDWRPARPPSPGTCLAPWSEPDTWPWTCRSLQARPS